MSKTRLFAGLLLALAVLLAQVGIVAAAPQAQETLPITGTVQSVTTGTDTNGATIVRVTLVDERGTSQTVNLSVETAVSLGLVTLDSGTGEPVVNETQVGQTVEVDPSAVIPGAEEDLHPIADILGDFFNVDASIVNDYHEDGFGFGVIAQAMWMSQGLNGDASAAGLILEAKKSGDYSAFTLPDGSAPSNWGQFKKAFKENKDKHNLGVIVSKHADDDTTVGQPDTDNNSDKQNKKEKKDKKDKKKP